MANIKTMINIIFIVTIITCEFTSARKLPDGILQIPNNNVNPTGSIYNNNPAILCEGKCLKKIDTGECRINVPCLQNTQNSVGKHSTKVNLGKIPGNILHEEK